MIKNRLERDTIILFNEKEPTASVFTHNRAYIKKLNKLCEDYPKQFRLERQEPEGGYSYIVPKQYIKINAPMKFNPNSNNFPVK